ncbi:polysaccharide lyase 8 family protein [Streptacidiphilus sp. P02-A3a]|uniref:polysaccharide lyase 8 family protein n=1 Tax=Streptacidiphilus sp. P02-A3a TaxID=2704468 RepID=UPI0015FB8719|nr:polysaccharide lyase 8 family protein [Streptacidiphilus sp. P02-A3a]QMU71979.1 polysaccharide lyase 8 family protein [Streptacidiphilus sp. P02-A3a]
MDDSTPLSTTLHRRHLLGAGAATAGAAVLGGLGGGTARAATTRAATRPSSPAPTTTPPGGSPDPYDQLRATWADILTGGSAVDPAAPDYAAAIGYLDGLAAADAALYDTSAAPASVYTDLPFVRIENISLSYGRLLTTALAWATPGSTQYQDPAALTRILGSLALINRDYYNATAAQVGNWYHWEIAAPQDLVNICALLGPALPAADLAAYLATVAVFAPDPTTQQQGTVVTTGANRTDLSQIVVMRGILGRDPALITLGRDALSGAFPYVTTSDGFYRDGGFIQHSVIPYNGHYAYVVLGDISQLLVLLTGSAWPITDPNLSVVLDAVDLGYAPFMQDGLVMDVVRGRFLSRQGESDHDAGHFITEAIARITPFGSREQQRRWKAQIKGWVRRETFARISATATPERISLLKTVLDDDRVPAAPAPTGHLQLPSVERVVHRRPGWAWTVGLSSSRIARLEAINGENQNGWHTGDGATYLYDSDNGQYTDNFWPTVDATRLPGVTADTLPLAPGAGSDSLPPTSWSGGAVLDGSWGAVGLDLVPFGSPLRARKSWFCLDDGVVALGAGITGSSGHTVETTLENRNLHPAGRNALTVDGRPQPVVDGWNSAFPNAGWVHLEGVGGYLLPPGAAGTAVLRAVREQRTGSWAAIDNGPSTAGSSAPCTNAYVTLWLDHGVDPVDGSYVYVVLPGADPAETARRAGRADLVVLSNTPALQAIHSSPEELTAANFFTAGALPSVSTSGPASVLLRAAGGRLRLAVSDPTSSQSSLAVTLPEATGYRRWVSDDPGVTVDLSGSAPVVTLDLTQGLPGTSRTVQLS